MNNASMQKRAVPKPDAVDPVQSSGMPGANKTWYSDINSMQSMLK